MKKIGILSVLIVSFMFLTISVNAQNDQRIEPIPNLTETQKTDIKKIKEAHKAEAKPLREEIKLLNKKHDELMKNYPADMKAINENLKKSSNKKLDLAMKTAKMQQDIKALLDEDQRKWYNENVLTSKKKDKPKEKQKGKKKGNK